MLRRFFVELSRHPRSVPVRLIRGTKFSQPLPEENNGTASDTGGGHEENEGAQRRRQRARILDQLERRNPAGKKGFNSEERQNDGDRNESRNRDRNQDQDHFGPRRDMNRNQDQDHFAPRRETNRSRNQDQDHFAPRRETNRSRNQDQDHFAPRRDINRSRNQDQIDFRPERKMNPIRDQDQDQFTSDSNRHTDGPAPEDRWQDQPSRSKKSFTNNVKRGNTGSIRTRYGHDDEETLGGSGGRVRKMLNQASTFNDLELEKKEEVEEFPDGQGRGQHLPRPDRFLSSPYTKETRMPNKVFHGGNSAMEEAQLQKIDPATTSVIFFPGQGTQYVGMCGKLSEMSEPILSLYSSASEFLGYDLLDICENGPIEKLNQTVYCQPAVLVSSLAALERLRDRNPKAIESCVATAGFSIGEITALVFAGVLSFEDALQLVKVRAEAMQLATELVPSAMATVLYGADSKLNYSLSVARAWCTKEFQIEKPVCSIANYLFPHCKVVGGNKEAIEFLQDNYKDFNLAKVKRLPVSGAFHTELMLPAAEAVRLCLEKLQINTSRIPVYSNVTGHRYHTSHELLRMLPRQIHKPVMWEQIMHNLYQRPKETEYPSTYECGPGQSLTTVLKLVNAKARMKAESIDP